MGEEAGVTSKAQPKKCENPTSNTGTNTTKDNSNSCISASRNIENGKVTNMETKSVPNDEGNKGEGSETEAETEAAAETEADTNSEDSKNNGNTGIDVGAKYDEYFNGVGDSVGDGDGDGDGVGVGVGDGEEE